MSKEEIIALMLTNGWEDIGHGHYLKDDPTGRYVAFGLTMKAINKLSEISSATGDNSIVNKGVNGFYGNLFEGY